MQWNDMPAAITEFKAIARFSRAVPALADGATQFRVIVIMTTIACSTGASILTQYWDGSAWQYPDTGNTGGAVLCDGAIADPKIGSWVNLKAAVQSDSVMWRIAGQNGDGTTGGTDPIFGSISVQAK
jgi:hypothetical protein